MEKNDISKNWVKELECLMEKLRSDNGCPWDREQSHDSLKKYLIEEAYELMEAIENGDDSHILDELGDVLLQVIFHCQIAGETHRFNLQKVAEGCCRKLIRRHPHVFGDKKVKNSDEVLKEWDRIKNREPLSRNRKSRLDGIPRSLPALRYAEKIQKKASQIGLDWQSVDGIFEKFNEELGELKDGIVQKDGELIREELGDLMFTAANLCRFLGQSAEDNLRSSNAKFCERFRYIEKHLTLHYKDNEEPSMEVLEDLWQQAKGGK